MASPAERLDAMVITNGAFKLMREWADGPLAREYSLSADWDDRWRTGGTVDEVIEEAHLDEAHILTALERFAAERPDGRQRDPNVFDRVRVGEPQKPSPYEPKAVPAKAATPASLSNLACKSAEVWPVSVMFGKT